MSLIEKLTKFIAHCFSTLAKLSEGSEELLNINSTVEQTAEDKSADSTSTQAADGSANITILSTHVAASSSTTAAQFVTSTHELPAGKR